MSKLTSIQTHAIYLFWRELAGRVGAEPGTTLRSFRRYDGQPLASENQLTWRRGWSLVVGCAALAKACAGRGSTERDAQVAFNLWSAGYIPAAPGADDQLQLVDWSGYNWGRAAVRGHWDIPTRM